MAKLTINDSLEEDKIKMDAMGQLPDSLFTDMLNAGADVVARVQREEVKKQWSGPCSEKISAESIKKGTVRKTKSGRTISVYPQGKRRRGKEDVRNAEIAFINEYGAPKREIVARPAIRTANKKAEDAAIEAMEKVLDDYLESMGF